MTRQLFSESQDSFLLSDARANEAVCLMYIRVCESVLRGDSLAGAGV